MAKAATWDETDAEVRKRGEQQDYTLVVHAVNDENWVLGEFVSRCRS